MIARTITKVNELIDIRMGILGAIFMGSWVFWINYDHGILEASIAASKQSMYTFFFGGLFVRMAENIAMSQSRRWVGILTGGVVPMIITSILTFGMHSLKGTPEPFHSTIPTMFFSFVSFSAFAWYMTRPDSDVEV